jgi:hypothetical protein
MPVKKSNFGRDRDTLGSLRRKRRRRRRRSKP